MCEEGEDDSGLAGDRSGDPVLARPPPPPPTTIFHHNTRLPPLLPLPPCAVSSPQGRLLGAAQHGAGASPQTVALPIRPGVELQDSFLREFYCPIITGHSVYPPAFIWLTPPSPSPTFNLHYVRNAVNFLLTSFPSRLCVVRVCPWVFRVTVSCQNVANALVVRGSLRLASSVLFVHHNLADARQRTMAFSFQNQKLLDEAEFTAIPTPNAADKTLPAALNSSDRPGAPGISAARRFALAPRLPAGLWDAARSMAAAPPAPASPSLLPPGLSAFTAPQPPAVASYLNAAQSPAKPNQPQAKSPQPITAKAVCFRCLSSEHSVRDCRDPVRCRNCRGIGHRQFSCKMPLSLALSPANRRRPPPTVPVPASRLPVHVKPFTTTTKKLPMPPLTLHRARLRNMLPQKLTIRKTCWPPLAPASQTTSSHMPACPLLPLAPRLLLVWADCLCHPGWCLLLTPVCWISTWTR